MTSPETNSANGLSRRESLDFELLQMLKAEPDLTQREMARRLGISLGRTNYCLRALTEKGAIKYANFRSSKTKARYAYVLTPKGLSQCAALAARFLERKVEEYERLKTQIESLKDEMRDRNGH